MSYHFFPNIVTDGLVFHIDAQNPNSYNNIGTEAYSLVKRENGSNFRRLTIQSGVLIQSMNDITYFFLNGVNYLSTFGFGTPMVNLSPNITYASWFSHNRSLPQGSVLFLPGNGASNSRTWLFPFGNSINARFTNGTTPFGIQFNGFTSTNYPNEFNYVVATCQLEPSLTSSTLSIYVNGVLVTQLTNQGVVNGRVSGPNEPDIGRGSSSASTRFNGKIATASIYNKCLSLDEIKQNYNTLKGRFNHN